RRSRELLSLHRSRPSRPRRQNPGRVRQPDCFLFLSQRASASAGHRKTRSHQLDSTLEPDRLLPRGTVANLDILTSALSEESSSTGYFNIYPDVDGVVRQSNLIVPYGRSKDFNDWDLYASLDVQTVRSYFRLPNEQVVLEYGPVGAYRIVFGNAAQVRTDLLGRVVINYHGPGYSYPHY